jgi:hypothetical protein
VGNYPPLRWISEYLVPSTDEETGIRWEPGLSVRDFLNRAKQLITFSERALTIKGGLDELFAENQE